MLVGNKRLENPSSDNDTADVGGGPGGRVAAWAILAATQGAAVNWEGWVETVVRATVVAAAVAAMASLALVAAASAMAEMA